MSKATLIPVSALVVEASSSSAGGTAVTPTQIAPATLNYRSLLAGSSQAVLIADFSDGRILEANPAASRLLRIPAATLVGVPLNKLFDGESVDAFETTLDCEIEARPLHRDAPLYVQASRVVAGGQTYLLIRMRLLDDATVTHLTAGHSAVVEAIDHAGVGLVLTDDELRIQFANQSFVQLGGFAAPDALCGRRLTSYLQLTPSDLNLLRDQRTERRAVTQLRVSFRLENGATRIVEVDAVAVPDGPHILWGFIIRELPRTH